MREEHWKPVKGYEGLYSVSDMGRVMSHYYDKDRILKPRFATCAKQRANEPGHDYQNVALSRNGRPVYRLIHLLVLEAFGPECQPGEVARHRRGVQDNSYPEGLEWGTPEENQADRQRDGTAGRSVRKLTEADAREIHALLRRGWTKTDIAPKFGVTRQNVQHLAAGRSFRKVWLEFNA